jgi:hypothetical protein
MRRPALAAAIVAIIVGCQAEMAPNHRPRGLPRIDIADTPEGRFCSQLCDVQKCTSACTEGRTNRLFTAEMEADCLDACGPAWKRCLEQCLNEAPPKPRLGPLPPEVLRP